MLINTIPFDFQTRSVIETGSNELSGTVAKLIYHADDFSLVEIPAGVKRLRGYIFNDVWPTTPLVITVPEGVTQVDSKAFCNCAIGTVTFPSTVTALPADCFADSSPEKIIIHRPAGSIAGYPWGADNEPEIEWKG